MFTSVWAHVDACIYYVLMCVALRFTAQNLFPFLMFEAWFPSKIKSTEIQVVSLSQVWSVSTFQN